MKAGKEPMRTFGDLMQFFQQKPSDEKSQPPTVQEEPSAVKDITPATVDQTPPAQDDPSV
jgi:hypothetical protein